MNQINRHNYESFFLLYIDNEISAAEKIAVDEFVQANPDLQEELIMLQQSILKVDDIVFDAKESLLKNEPATHHLYEKLLLHLDGELSTSEEIELQQIISSDVSAKKEWLLLKQTKLTADTTVIFENKQLLYRKESTKIIALPWFRLAAAAVFIGFAIWAGIAYLNNTNKPAANSVASKTDTKPAIKTTPANTSINKEASKEPVNIEEIATSVSEKNSNEKKSSNKVLLPANNSLTQPDAPAPVNEIAITQPDNNLPKLYSENINNDNSNKTITTGVTTQKPHNIIEHPGKNEIVTDQEKPISQVTTFAATTSFPEGSDEKNNDRVFFMEEEKLKKTKLGGVFRKVKRVFERNTNMKSGNNNIKVANLEFAIQ